MLIKRQGFYKPEDIFGVERKVMKPPQEMKNILSIIKK